MTLPDAQDSIRTSPRVGVVILNWNGRDDTLQCLDSVRGIDYPAFFSVVVDNGSTDGSVAAIRERHPDATVLDTGRNHGFAEGNNIGIREALRRGAAFVLLVNNDAVVDKTILTVLVDAAARYPEAGVFSGRIYYHDDPSRIWYSGARWVGQEGRFVKPGADTIDAGGESHDAHDTDYACGCLMFFSAHVVNHIGLLDPRFFLTFEETDWCFRARKAGYRCLVVPEARAWHKVSASFGSEDSPLYAYFHTRNRLLWAERHLPLGQRLRVWRRTASELSPRSPLSPGSGDRSLRRLYWNARAAVASAGAQWRSPTQRAGRLAVRDYVLRRFGDCPALVRALNAGQVAHAGGGFR